MPVDMKDAPCCEVGMCFFRASINLCGKWVCEHHAPAESTYIRKYGHPYRESGFVPAGGAQ